jgi:hypothetical protein
VMSGIREKDFGFELCGIEFWVYGLQLSSCS